MSVLEKSLKKSGFDLYLVTAKYEICMCGKLCPLIIRSDSVIYSGPNKVKMENIGPKYLWLGQHSMDWTKKEMD